MTQLVSLNGRLRILRKLHITFDTDYVRKINELKKDRNIKKYLFNLTRNAMFGKGPLENILESVTSI